MPLLVSILIPAYNAEPWIAETINSALAQTWPNKEIIIVNDGSKDTTLAIAQKFAAANVKIHTQPNQGAAATRNKLASLAQGDYLQWLDADDLLSPHKVSSQMAAAEQGDSRRTLFSSGWAYFLSRAHKARFVPTLLWDDLTPVEWMLRKFEHNLHMQTATWLVSRELTEAAGPWHTQLLGDDDGEYFSRVIMACDGIRFIREAKVFYRNQGCNRLSFVGASNQKLEAQFNSMKMQIGYLRSMSDDKRARAVCVDYLQTWLVYFYPNRMDIVEQARQLAAELGGQLDVPNLPWKYHWIQRTLGWPTAKKAQRNYNEWKWGVLRKWDRAMFKLEGRKRS